MKKLTRQEAIAIVGEDAVNAVERINCEPTGRVGFNGSCKGDDLCEWVAGGEAKDEDGDSVTICAYYYTTNAEDETMADTGDGSNIDWQISHYEVV